MAKAASTANVALIAKATNQTICLTKTLIAKKTLYYNKHISTQLTLFITNIIIHYN